ncbi:hypothetical protein EV360DRAFT_79190 [Lentinula raphanica]|nr:hypothetical protein EV360DRAFT_79190 [Lentinula raphanica]
MSPCLTPQSLFHIFEFSIMPSFPPLLIMLGMIMMAGQINAAVVRRLPAGRRTFPKRLAATSSDEPSDPISSVDFYFPFKDLQTQIQSANIECPAPGGSYDQALSLISSNCPSNGADNVPITPCCTQDMLTDLAGTVICVQSSDMSLASSMQMAIRGFIQQCQQAGVNGLTDPLSSSISLATSTRPTTSMPPTASTSKSAPSTTITPPMSSPLTTSSRRPLSTTFSSSFSSSSTTTSGTSAPSTSHSSSALRSISLHQSGSIMGAIGMILITMLATLLHL